MKNGSSASAKLFTAERTEMAQKVIFLFRVLRDLCGEVFLPPLQFAACLRLTCFLLLFRLELIFATF